MGAIGSILGVGFPGASSVNPAAATATNAAGSASQPASIAGTAAAKGTGNDFGDVIANALDGLQGVQSNADGLAVKAATGDLNDVHDYMIAASEASLATEFTVALRDRAVEAFNQIMGMQI
jgi:flagellar hook-basal body complex protein FliE